MNDIKFDLRQLLLTVRTSWPSTAKSCVQFLEVTGAAGQR